MTDPAPLLAMEGVTFAYHATTPALDKATFAARAGSLHAIIGPNAAGKTTLLRVMLGQLTPDAGAVRFAGRLIDHVPPRQRARRLAYVPQRSSTSFAFTTRQVVAMGRFASGDDAPAVAAALEDCDLARLADRAYLELSAGQQQRALVARALAQIAGADGPAAMLLDEPTSAMDLAHTHGAMRRLRRLADAGVAVMVVMHDLNLAARYADHVSLLACGQVVADGPWDAVLRRDVLEPIYGVSLEQLQRTGPGGASSRPLFDVALSSDDPSG